MRVRWNWLALAMATMALGCSDEPAAAPSGTGGAGGAGGAAPAYAEPYSLQPFDRTRINSHSDQENFHNAFAEIDFRDGPFADVKLVIDLDTTCFPFESWMQNPPPPGHNWPADCDAFDRNFQWSLDDPEEEGEPPGFEIVHAVTPFGGPQHLEIDITDVANGLPGKHRLRAHITTWSDGAGQVSGSNGGWFVSARIDATPGPPPRNVLALGSLFYGTQSDLDGPGPLSFEVPEGATGGRIEFRHTGHGGGPMDLACSGPSDEFCRRNFTASLDGTELEAWIPWRDDCTDLCTIAHYGPADGGFDYCQENPCGAVSSVRAQRANWCPGSLSPPKVWEPPALAVPGSHELDWTIDRIGDGGSWSISASYFVYGP